MRYITPLAALLLMVSSALIGCVPISPTAEGAGQSVATPSLVTTPAAGENDSEATDDQTFTGGIAMVDAIEVRVLESFPVQAEIVARGNLPDGCTAIDEAMIEQADDQVRITLTTLRPADAMCTQALVPFEEIIALDVAALPAGEYTVTVNDVTETFTLEGADGTTESSTPAPTAPITSTSP